MLVDNSTWNVYNFRLPIIRQLQGEGYRVRVLAPPDSFAGLLNLPHLTPLQNLRARSRSVPGDLGLLAELLRQYFRLRPDLILHFTIKPNIYGSLAARLLDIPAVAVVTGLGYPFLHGGWQQGLVRRGYRLALRLTQQVVCFNAEDRAFLIRAGMGCPGRVAVIPGSGVDLRRFRPQRVPTGLPFRFLFVGRLLYDKGLREYVEAARQLGCRYPEVEWQILGEYNPEYPDSVMAEELIAWSAEKGIRYLGQVRDVRPWLRSSSVVVLPSYREGLPRSLQEALAMGRPVITTDVAGCREIVDAGQNGWLVPARRTGDLAKAMEVALQTEPEQIRRMGQHSRRLACRRFDDRKIALQFSKLVKRILYPAGEPNIPHAITTRTHSQGECL